MYSKLIHGKDEKLYESPGLIEEKWQLIGEEGEEEEPTEEEERTLFSGFVASFSGYRARPLLLLLLLRHLYSLRQTQAGGGGDTDFV